MGGGGCHEVQPGQPRPFRTLGLPHLVMEVLCKLYTLCARMGRLQNNCCRFFVEKNARRAPPGYDAETRRARVCATCDNGVSIGIVAENAWFCARFCTPAADMAGGAGFSRCRDAGREPARRRGR